MRKVLNFFHLKNMSNTIIHKQQPEGVLLKRTIKKGALQNFATYKQENTCPGLFFNKTYLKRWLQYRRFPVNSAEFLRKTFFTEHLWTTASDYISFIRGVIQLDFVGVVLILSIS